MDIILNRRSVRKYDLNKKISANKIGKMYGTTHKIIISSLQKSEL